MSLQRDVSKFADLAVPLCAEGEFAKPLSGLSSGAERQMKKAETYTLLHMHIVIGKLRIFIKNLLQTLSDSRASAPPACPTTFRGRHPTSSTRWPGRKPALRQKIKGVILCLWAPSGAARELRTRLGTSARNKGPGKLCTGPQWYRGQEKNGLSENAIARPPFHEVQRFYPKHCHDWPE
jgi:hypothetical protein